MGIFFIGGLSKVINAIFAEVQLAVTNFATALSSSINSITALFWTESSGTYTITALGSLLLIAVGVGLVYFAVRFIMRLVRRA